MPSERFLKLSEEKQKRIMQAAMDEFARVPFENVSINKIIQEADISRGSFYTYFEDKRDLLAYIFRCNWKMMFSSLRDCLLQEKGDIWKAMDSWFAMVLSHRNEAVIQQNIRILTNAGCGHESELFKGEGFSKERMEQHLHSEEEFRWMLAHIDPETMNLNRSFEDLKTLFQMLIGLTMMALMGSLVHDEDVEKIQKKYRTILDYFRYGACSKERRAE